MSQILDKEKYEKLKEDLLKAREGKSDKSISEILNEMKKYVIFEEKKYTEEEKKDMFVEDIIEIIANKYESRVIGNAVATFTEGYCYYFAVMLQRIFKEEAEIYTDMGAGHHAIVKIGNNFYDINGNIKRDFDRNGEIRNKIDPNQYLPTEGEYFLSFIDWCNYGRNKENIENTEKICDEITDEIIDMLKNSKKNQI